MTRIDASLDFKFIGHFEDHKVNWGHNFGFMFLMILTVCEQLFTKQ